MTVREIYSVLTRKTTISTKLRMLAVGCLMPVCGVSGISAQTVAETVVTVTDSLDRALVRADSMLTEDAEVMAAETMMLRGSDRTDEPHAMMMSDSAKIKKPKRDWQTWTPNPQRALWLAMVLPGAGQIYNRKYWKLPIFYGGMMGCLYAMNWNNMMYKDYSQAYLDIMDDDPTTESYNRFLHLGRKIDSSNEERYKTIFKSRKDRYRRWRDMSFFCLLGVYALSIIDAYVDAELSEFDISKDLSLRVEPTIINGRGSTTVKSLDTSALGLQCSLTF